MSEGNSHADSVNPGGNGDVICASRTLSEFLQAVSELTRQVEALHQQKQLHLGIHWDAVQWNDEGQLQLPPPKVAAEFGGVSFNEELCPLAMQTPRVVEVPSNLADARRVLDEAKIPIAPEAIDLYQLGTLLCRLITREPVSSYFRSPRTKSQIPPGLQQILKPVLEQYDEHASPKLDRFAEDLAALARASLAENQPNPSQRSHNGRHGSQHRGVPKGKRHLPRKTAGSVFSHQRPVAALSALRAL